MRNIRRNSNKISSQSPQGRLRDIGASHGGPCRLRDALTGEQGLCSQAVFWGLHCQPGEPLRCEGFQRTLPGQQGCGG